MPPQPPVQGTLPPVPQTQQTHVKSETYNPEQPSILETEEVLQEKKVPLEKNSMKEEEDRSQDELVQIAMGNVPLTPILGQPQAFPINGATTMNFPDLIQTQQMVQPPPTIDGQLKQNVKVTGNKPYHGGKNTALEIRKIPSELNNMVKLSEHFQKFGTITKLQVIVILVSWCLCKAFSHLPLPPFLFING